MTTLRKELEKELKQNNETFSDILKINIEEDFILDTDLPIGTYTETPDFPDFIAWTNNFIYFRVSYNDGDGGYGIFCISRNPNDDLYGL